MCYATLYSLPIEFNIQEICQAFYIYNGDFHCHHTNCSHKLFSVHTKCSQPFTNNGVYQDNKTMGIKQKELNRRKAS